MSIQIIPEMNNYGTQVDNDILEKLSQERNLRQPLQGYVGTPITHHENPMEQELESDTRGAAKLELSDDIDDAYDDDNNNDRDHGNGLGDEVPNDRSGDSRDDKRSTTKKHRSKSGNNSSDARDDNAITKSKRSRSPAAESNTKRQIMIFLAIAIVIFVVAMVMFHPKTSKYSDKYLPKSDLKGALAKSGIIVLSFALASIFAKMFVK